MARITGKLGIDVPSVTQDEALEFMIYHLGLAASYFEATPDQTDCLQEMKRIMGTNSLALKAAMSWYHTIETCYKEMEEG